MIEKVRLGSRVTAVVHSGSGSERAGFQILVDGKTRSGHILPLANKKKPLRICVGEPNMRSSVWNIWANRNVSDVYLAIRSSASLHKISLHASGDFRYQLIGTNKEDLDSPDLALISLSKNDTGRIVHQWVRPDPLPNGWTDCMCIHIPAGDLQPGNFNMGNPNAIEWIPAPVEGKAVEIRGFLIEPGLGEMGLSNGFSEGDSLSFLGGFKLVNGQVFVLLARTVAVDREEQESIRAEKERARRKAHPRFDWSAENTPRILMTATDLRGYPTFMDLQV